MLKSIVKNWWALQALAAKLICGVPSEVHHNFGKLAALRKAFSYASLEGVEGDYLEFGVYEGTSMIAAIHSYERQNAHTYQGGKEKKPCRFFGFDSFEGFRPDAMQDIPHFLWKDGVLASSYEKVSRRLHKYTKRFHVQLIKGFYQDVLSERTMDELGVKKVRVCLIDCDLKSSTRDAIRYSASCWQAGTVLIFDDYFAYLGNPDAGEAGALKEFCEEHPEFRYREFGQYGVVGLILIVTSPPVLNRV